MGELLDDSELRLFDSISEEYNRLGGTKVRLWSLRRGYAVDPVFDEPSRNHGYDPMYGEAVAPSHQPEVEPEKRDEWAFVGPWEFWAVVFFEEEADKDTSIDESVQSEWDATGWVSRQAFEEIDCPYPKKGDVIEMSEEKWRDSSDKQIYFDVISSARAGPLNDTQTYVNQRLRLKKRTKFDPERRIY